MSVEDRVANLEQPFLALNKLVKRTDERHELVAKSIKLLTEMLARHNERFEQVEADQSNADQRIAALADAQIKTEETLVRLQSKTEEVLVWLQSKTEEALVRLSEAQARTEATINSLAQKVDTLADIVQQGRNGNS
ncbi:MAG: hypothetical protein ICV60_03425 [Pyrinomonadaceae bacterium]|nr:hypothetical protein [Pyrinomonadaceae bacterium]